MLATQGKNVLRKEPMGREIADEDVFFYNAGFTSKFYKVKVGTVSAQKETEPEKADTRHKARPPWPISRAALPGMLSTLGIRSHAQCCLCLCHMIEAVHGL